MNKTSTVSLYTCPMHPEIQQDHPGSCPICGMSLDPVLPSSSSEAEDAEYREMRQRLSIAAPLSALVSLLAYDYGRAYSC